MTSYRLGLDVGANSLGWSILALDEQDEKNTPCRLIDTGVRIFSDGRDVKSMATLKAERRMARSARRRRDRFKQRQTFLIDELQKAGLFPTDAEAMKQLQSENPLELRSAALNKKLSAHQVGRALFHLNQRRGFKSNRKDRTEDVVKGKVSSSARLLLEQMELIGPPPSQDEYRGLSKEEKKQARHKETEDLNLALEKLSDNKALTYGTFLWKRHQQGKPTRARPGAGDDGKLYDVYPTRELYEDEFNKIWDKQKEYHHELMCDKARKRIHAAIFTQRRLKTPERGKCAYLPDEDRTFRAMPSFQRCRMLQDLNNLEWTVQGRTHRLLDYPDARDAIFRAMETVSTRNGQFVWSKMKKILKDMELTQGDFSFNYESPKRKGLEGNLTSNIMQQEDYVGRAWHSWAVEKQDSFITVILEDELDDEEVKRRLMDEFHLSDYAASKCMDAHLVEGTASFSLQAARLLTQKMHHDMLGQVAAVEAVARDNTAFVNPFTRVRRGELLNQLPYYGEAFQDGRHIMPGTQNPGDRNDELTFFGGVTNPTVHIALNQIRQVVNELIKRYGHPYSIAIELARDLPAGSEKRREIENEQKKNQDKNEQLDKKLRELGHIANRDNRLRLLLWEELDTDPTGRCCPFTGTTIGITDLFNGSTEIEHLIPFSISLDDSRANKVICMRRSNRDKGQRTPFEAFGHSPENYLWEEIAARAERLPAQKKWRFQEDARESWNKGADFSERHLNDTRYIGRLAREYLESICPYNKIDVLTGRLTALLRGHWGLNSVMGQTNRKTRDDHRHHAIDAVVVGMTTRAMLQKVSTAAGRAEELDLEHLFPKGQDGRSPIDPWDNFREEVKGVVQNIVVSHKPKRKKAHSGTTDGQLHNETAYGIVSGPDDSGRYEVVTRWQIDKFKTRQHLKTIRDPHLREKFLNAFDSKTGADSDKAKAIIDLASDIGIRSLRRTEKLKVIPVKDKSGDVYKAYQGDSNWGMEIYQYPAGHKKANKWEGVVISRFEANQPGFKPGQSHKPHPAARLIMRLQINDCIEIEQDNRKRFFRLQRMSQGGQLVFAPSHEANVDARNRDPDDPFKYLLKQANALKPLYARKVHISPAGRVNYEHRQKAHDNQ